MLTYGFYNSVNHDRMYDAEQISSIFDGVINDGVFLSVGDKFAVTAGSGMQVRVGTGRAWFNHTWTLNDTILPVDIGMPAEAILSRIDSVVLEVNADTNIRENAVKIVHGTPASNPVPPALTRTQYVNQYRLANVKISPGSKVIHTGDITITVGTSECPYVTGILQSTNIDELYSKWEYEFAQLMGRRNSEFDDWFDNIREKLDHDVAGNLQNQIDAIKDDTISSAHANGILVNALAVDVSNPKAAINKPHIVNNVTTTVGRPSDCISGVRTVYFANPNQLVAVIFGRNSRNKADMWINSYYTNDWSGWVSFDSIRETAANAKKITDSLAGKKLLQYSFDASTGTMTTTGFTVPSYT